MVLQSIADLLVYAVAIIAVQISFYAMNRQNAGTVISVMLGASAIVYVFGRMFFPFPHIREVIPPYVYWHADIPAWLQMMTGAVALLGSVVFVVTFVVLGFRARANSTVYRRSLFLAGGMTCLFFASLIFFIFATGGFFLTLFASVLGIAGLLFMLNGIPYRDEHNEHIDTYHASTLPKDASSQLVG
jgi:hypothetical protein